MWRVESCLVQHCRRHGLHPGTGGHDSILSGNISRYNGEDGFYFCYDTHGIIVTGNVIHDNRMGISGLGWGGRTGNICINASRQKEGRYVGICLEHTTDTLVIGNHCGNEGEDGRQGYGIIEHGKSDRNLIIGNQCSGNLKADIAIVGANTQASGNSAKPMKWAKWPK
jgi:parallel beta-helix repeat protein